MDDLEHFYLSPKELRDMIEFLAKKRKIKNYNYKSSHELLQAIKENKDKEQKSRNKKKMDIITEKLNNFLRIESKEIRKNFYNIEKILNLNEYKVINSIRNLFKLSIDKPSNYIQYKIIHSNPLHTTIYTIYFYIKLLAQFIIFLNFFYFSIV